MKKTLFFIASIFMLLTSCKKEHTCECVMTSNAPGWQTNTTLNTTGKMKMDDAKQKCNTGDGTTTAPKVTGAGQDTTITYYDYKQECNLKD